MASTDVRRLERNHTQTLDPVGYRLALEGRLSANEGLGEALRQRSEQGSLPSCPEGYCLPSVGASMMPAAASSSLPPARPDSSGTGTSLRRGSAGASHSGSLHSTGTPRTPLSAEYAQALQRNSQRLLEAVASSASSGLGGSAENPVPLPEQETLMLPLAAVPAGSPRGRVRAAAKAAAAAGEQPPSPKDKGDAAGAPRRVGSASAVAAAEGEDAADGDSDVPAAGGAAPALQGASSMALGCDDAANGCAAGDAPDPCTCPPFAVKATCGKRPIMEDTYALCPNICELPMPPMTENFADKLPQRIAVQLANGDPSADTSDVAAVGIAGAGGAGAGNATHVRDGGGPSSGSTFGSCVEGVTPLEKLHFFGVYDGHGGIQASQHCAARLHHHLSASLRELAIGFLGQAPADSVGSADNLEEAEGAWRAPVVPEVQFVPVYRGLSDGACAQEALGGADDCLIAVAAAAAAAAEAGKPLGAGGDATQEDEDALRALTRESSGDDEQGASPPAEGEGEGEPEDAASADGSEGENSTSMCALLEEALREAFLKTDEEFSADGTAGLVGSTAVCALVGTHRVWIANCGDSRAVLCRGGQAVQVTDDHKPEREDEAERVEKAGGQVLYWNGHRVMGVLAMSRAIGDHCLRPYVIPEPEITVFKRHSKDEILLLASDGLWDVMPNQEATDLAMRCIRRARDKGASPKAAARVAATILTKAAVDRGSRDNITVMVIDLSRGAGGGDGGSTAASAEGSGEAQGVKKPSGGRLAAAAAAAEAAAGANKRPVPQRIITEQPSVTAAPPAAAQAQHAAQQHALPTEVSVVAPAAKGPFVRMGAHGASPFVAVDGISPDPVAAPAAPAVAAAQPQRQASPARMGCCGGPFGSMAAVAAAVVAPLCSEPPSAPAAPQAPVTAQRQGSSSPFGALNLTPF